MLPPSALAQVKHTDISFCPLAASYPYVLPSNAWVVQPGTGYFCYALVMPMYFGWSLLGERPVTTVGTVDDADIG